MPVCTRGGRANLGSSVNTCVKLAGFVRGEMGQRKFQSLCLGVYSPSEAKNKALYWLCCVICAV